MTQRSRFDSMKFPAYQFREYPKHVRLPNGKHVTVNSKQEENEALGIVEPVIEAPIMVVEAPIQEPLPQIEPVEFPKVEFASDDGRAALVARADELNIPYDKRWGIKKLKDAIEAAEEAEDQPAE